MPEKNLPKSGEDIPVSQPFETIPATLALPAMLERMVDFCCSSLGATSAVITLFGEDNAPKEHAISGDQEIADVLTRALDGQKDLSNLLRCAGADISFPPETLPPDVNLTIPLLAVPVNHNDTFLGIMMVTGTREGLADEMKSQVLELAHYAGYAITNARLFSDLQRQKEDLALLNQLSAALSSTTDIDRIMDTTLTQLMSYLSIDVGEIYLLQEDSPTLRQVHHHGKQVKSIWNHDHYTLRHSALGEITRGANPRVLELPRDMLKELNPHLAEQGCRQIACVPIAGSKDPLGVLCLASCRDRDLDEMEMNFLVSASARVGSAIENVRHTIQGRRIAILEERERIGMDLHDGIIQSIYAVGLTLEHARLLLNEDSDKSKKRIEQAIADLNAAIRDIRTYILDLRPRRLLDENLMEGIGRLVQEFRSNTLLEVNLKGPEEGALDGLSSANALALFLICQEALANIAKHARARHISVVVWTARDRVLLEVHDDGKGFDIEKAHATLGHGLSNMEIRARNARGEVDVTSEQGMGTTVLAWVPLRKKG